MSTKHINAGQSLLVQAMRFAAWARQRRTFPSVQEVVHEFECHPATANRWLNAYEQAHGIPRPRQEGGRKRDPRGRWLGEQAA